METVKQSKSSLKYYTKKYRPLEHYLRSVSSNFVILRYSDIERIIDGQLPRSAYVYPAWWSNGGQNHATAWLNAGWKVVEVKFGEHVKFEKISG